MAISTCLRCNGTIFETNEYTPKGSNFKQNFIQCSACGGVAGVVGYYDSGVILKRQEATLGEIQDSLRKLKRDVDHIASRIR